MTPVMDQEIESKALTTVGHAKGIVVIDNGSRILAAEAGRAIAALIKEAEEFFAPMKKAAAATHREICVHEHRVLDPLEEAKKHLSLQIGTFDQRMEAERLAAEQRLQADLQRQAEADARKFAEEQALEDCYALEADGDQVGADAVLANPAPVAVYVPPVVLPSSVQKAKGVSSQQLWKFKITNPELIPREYLVVNEQAIGQVVRALKDKTVIPGIAVYPESKARFTAS